MDLFEKRWIHPCVGGKRACRLEPAGTHVTALLGTSAQTQQGTSAAMQLGNDAVAQDWSRGIRRKYLSFLLLHIFLLLPSPAAFLRVKWLPSPRRECRKAFFS